MDLVSFNGLLDKNTADTLQLAKACSPASLAFKPGDKWSIIEILEHICNTDKVLHILISRPSASTSSVMEIIGDEKLKELVVTRRDELWEAPERLRPAGNIKDLDSFEKIFLQSREQLKQDLGSGKIVIDNRIHRHPFLGEMTISDWLAFIIYHTERHCEQIKDIMAMQGRLSHHNTAGQ